MLTQTNMRVCSLVWGLQVTYLSFLWKILIRFQFSIIFVKTESLLSLNDYTLEFGMHTESTGMGICIVTVPSMGPM